MRSLIQVLILLLSTASVSANSSITDCSMVDGWAQKGEQEEFVPDNLFDYMNGNAEGYIVFGFQRLTTTTCISGENRIVIDISEMDSPELAYGIFATNRHPRHEILAIGTAGQVMPRRATFAKGNLYVELIASGDRDQTETLRQYCHALDKKIEGSTDLPPEISWFPAAGLDKDSIRLVPESVLGLRMLGRGYLAKYDLGRAFIVAKRSEDEAESVLDQLKERLTGVVESEEIGNCFSGKDKYLGQMIIVRKGDRIVGFSDLKEGSDPIPRMKELLSNIP